MNDLLEEFKLLEPLGFRYCVVHIDDNNSVAWFIIDSDARDFIGTQYVATNYKVMTQKELEGAVQ